MNESDQSCGGEKTASLRRAIDGRKRQVKGRPDPANHARPERQTEERVD